MGAVVDAKWKFLLSKIDATLLRCLTDPYIVAAIYFGIVLLFFAEYHWIASIRSETR